MTEKIFTLSGPIMVKAAYYAERDADRQLFENCLAGEYSYIFSQRQMGKTSLMYHAQEQLAGEGIITVIVDLQQIGRETVTDVYQWYYSILVLILRKLSIEGFDLRQWWLGNKGMSPTLLFIEGLHKIISLLQKPVVVFIDEIEMSLKNEFSRDFMGAIRSMYIERSEDAVYRLLSFVLLGQTRLADLVGDFDTTPYNIGSRIELEDFTLEEILPLVEAIDTVPEDRGKIAAVVLEFTGGQPFLTQQLCNQLQTLNTRILDRDQVAAAVDLLTQNAKVQEHLGYIKSHLSQEKSGDILLRIYGYILSGNKVKDDPENIHLETLKLSGVVVARNKLLEPKNAIYRDRIGLEWVVQALQEKRAVEPNNFSLAEQYLAVMVPGGKLPDRPPEVEAGSDQPDVPNASEAASTYTGESDFQSSPEPGEFEFPDLEVEPEKKKWSERLRDFFEAIGSIRFSLPRRSRRLVVLLMMICITSAGLIWLSQAGPISWPSFPQSTPGPVPTDSPVVDLPISAFMNWAIGLGIAIIVLVVVGLIVSIRSDRRAVEDRLDRYLEQEDRSSKSKELSLDEWANKRVARYTFADRIAARLARANLVIKPGEYYALIVISIFFFGFLFFSFGRQSGMFLLGAVVGWLIPPAWVAYRRNRRDAQFHAQIPEFLAPMPGILRTGLSTMQAFEAVIRRLPLPMSDELRRVVQEMQLGLSMEAALDNLLRRNPHHDLDLIVTAINIQREVGGNLAEVLDSIYDRIVQSREAKRSSTVIGLPVFVIFLLFQQAIQWEVAGWLPQTELSLVGKLLLGVHYLLLVFTTALVFLADLKSSGMTKMLSIFLIAAILCLPIQPVHAWIVDGIGLRPGFLLFSAGIIGAISYVFRSRSSEWEG